MAHLFVVPINNLPPALRKLEREVSRGITEAIIGAALLTPAQTKALLNIPVRELGKVLPEVLEKTWTVTRRDGSTIEKRRVKFALSDIYAFKERRRIG